MEEPFVAHEKKSTNIIKKITNVFTGIAIGAIVAMLAIVITDVVMRLFFSWALLGSGELVRMMMICITPAFAAAMLEDRHISVGFLIDKFGRKGQLVFTTFACILSGGICSLICWQIYKSMLFAFQYKEFYSLLRIPKWPFSLIFCCAMAIMVFAIVVVLVRQYRDKDAFVSKKDEAAEEIERYGTDIQEGGVNRR